MWTDGGRDGRPPPGRRRAAGGLRPGRGGAAAARRARAPSSAPVRARSRPAPTSCSPSSSTTRRCASRSAPAWRPPAPARSSPSARPSARIPAASWPTRGAERDVVVIDAALVRGERGAEEGQLVLYCGGPEEAVDRVREDVAAFTEAVVHVGDVGAGQVAKTANNILLWACIRADVEALRLGRALGVDPAVCARRWRSAAAPTGRSRSGASTASAGRTRTSRSRSRSPRRPASRCPSSRELPNLMRELTRRRPQRASVAAISPTVSVAEAASKWYKRYSV